MGEQNVGATRPSGHLGLAVIRAGQDPAPVAVTRSAERDVRERFDRITGLSAYPAHELSLAEIVHWGLPRAGLDDRVNAWRASNLRHLARGARRAVAARALRLANFYGSLYLTKISADGEVVEYGLASMRVVTTAGVNFLVDALQGTVEPEILRYHGIGTGTNAEASGDAALQTEITTAYNPDSTRATGTLTEGASANIFRSVGTNTVDGAAAITEHGVLSQAATGGGTLLDRSVFSVINLASGDGLQSTYDFTLTAGS
jgi:hypothetical protein